MSIASLEGEIRRVDRRGKQIVCFEGDGLRKVGRGETIRIEALGSVYTGELVAIGPRRAIVLISPAHLGHGIAPQTAPIGAAVG